MNIELKIILKTISYRLLAIIASIPFIGIKGSIQLHIILAIIYYVHEKIWSLSKTEA